MSLLNQSTCARPPGQIISLVKVAPPSAGIAVPSLVKDTRADEIAIIAHELRNSLGVMRNAARLLRLPAGTAGTERARTLIERHVLQMNRHVQDLLDAAQHTGRKSVLRAHVDLRVVLRNCLDGIAPDLARRGHRLAVSLPADRVWLHADGARLEQVFSNLLINAAKYTPDGGDISVTMACVDGQAAVHIRDSGIGIAPTLIASIFDMFVQVDATAPRAEGGRGIGLAVVRDLLDLHGGTVHAVSAGLGLGSEFVVLLPALWAVSEKGVAA
jgi:signal transduction histidine kinase